MTTLVGSQTATTGAGAWSGGTNPFTAWKAFVASASGTLTSLNINMHAGNAGSHVVLGIYNAAGTSLLGYTTSQSLVSGIITASTNVGVAITSGTTYVLAAQFDYGYPDIYTDGVASYIQEDDTAQTFGTLPASLTNSTSNNPGTPAIWGTSSSGTAYTLTAATGTFSLTGEAATRAMALPAAEGAFAFTGHAATAGYGLGASEGAFGLTGNAATLTWSGAPVPKGSRGAHWSLSPAIGLCA